MANVGFSDLMFMDKRGHDYGWRQDADGVWRGTVLIDKVSRGLFETEKILCMQKYPTRHMSYESEGEGIGEHLVGGVKVYEYGKVSLSAGGSDGDYYAWVWDDSNTEVGEINMFRFDHSQCPPEDTSALVYNEYDCPNIELTGEVRIDSLPRTVCRVSGADLESELKYVNYEIDGLVPEASTVDLCFCNTESKYNTFRRDLVLVYFNSAEKTITRVAEISVYAESIEEDERYSVMCANLGYGITNDDFKIFKESDIKEQKVDYRLMNEKRKEMLMEGHSIYPYIGSYKSLINVIRYFGYDNIHIKEWWKNVDVTSEDYGNYFIATSYSLVDRERVSAGGRNITLPSRKFRKTNRMTLAWDIDRIRKAAVQERAHDLPETEEVFAFTIEEAVIKLYAFRRKLEKEFLPLNCHIVDMVGEMFGFDYNVVRTNVSDRKTFDTFVGCECDFNVITDDEDVYLEDLRRFDVFNESISQPTSGDVTLEEIYNEYVRDYNVLDEESNVLMPIVAESEDDLDGLGDECVIDGVTLRNGKPISLFGHPALYDVKDAHNGCTWNYYEYFIGKGEKAGNYYVANFSHYYPNLRYNSVRANEFSADMNEHLPDNDGALVGALVRLQCVGLGTSWDDASAVQWDMGDYIWDECENHIANHQRITWEIWKGEDGSPEFFCSVTGEFRYGYGDIGILLPYVGKYSVRCVIGGFDNSISERIKTECVEVLPKNVEVSGWFRHKADVYETWGDVSELDWFSADFGWDFPFIAGNATWDDMNTATYESLDRATFAGEYYDSDDIDERMVVHTFNQDNSNSPHGDWNGIYFWDNVKDINWLGLEHLDWNSTVIGGDIRPHFTLGGFDTDGNRTWSGARAMLEVITDDNRYGRFVFPDAVEGTPDILLVVNALNACEEDVISEFEYHYVSPFNRFEQTDFPDTDLGETGYEIIAVARHTDLGIREATVNTTINRAVQTDGIWRLTKPAGYFGNSEVSVSDWLGRTATAGEWWIYDGAGSGETICGRFVSHGDTVTIMTVDGNSRVESVAVASGIYGIMRRWFSEWIFNPSWIDTTYMNTYTAVPKNTDINLNYSMSRINGKCCPQWEVRNLDNPNTPVITSTHKNFHHLFRDTGRYNVKLVLRDTNGNVYVSDRCMFEVV